jgi:IclR family transcriptional regulator, KDG regulon repressor
MNGSCLEDCVASNGFVAGVPLENTADTRLRTLEKGLMVLEAIVDAGRAGITVTALGRALGLHRSTLHRFLATLSHAGYIETCGTSDRYRLSFKALSFASAALTGLPLRDVGVPILEWLAQTTRETVHIVVLDQGEVVTIDRIEGEHPITLRTQVGARRPAYCSATGKAMLAFMSDSLIDEILARGMPARTARTITTVEAYRAQLQTVRQLGYGIDEEEFVDGIRCVASPVFDLTGRVIGAISLSAPTMRVNNEQFQEFIEAVCSAARQLSRQLGYRASTGMVESNTTA